MMALVVSCGDDDEPSPTPDPEPEIKQPTSSFTSVVEDLTVTLTNTSENGVSFAWDFGDGNSSTEQSPSHTYAEAGDYTVSLTVTGEEGSTAATSSSTVTVTAADPCAGFDGSQPGNLLIGGGFEACDVANWTVLHSGQKDQAGEFAHAKYEFGYTDYAPADGEGGALYIYPDNDASSFEEGTILYQELSLETGFYNIDGLVKAAGENQADPTSAMNSYWFEIVVNQAVPEEGDGYNNQRATGWIYGGWTGWQVELPALDGPIPHDHMDNNLADADGNFNVTEAGTYYVVIKFGKGDDAAGASFGDGIALDNLNLERIGDVDPCADHTGIEEGNLVVGGQMEVCDDQNWTIVGTGAQNLPKVVFGSEANSPTDGSGGSFQILDPDNLAEGEQVEMVMYRAIELEADKTYVVSGLINHGPLTATDVSDGGPKEAFMSLEIADAAPVEGTQWKDSEGADAKVLLHRYCVCWMGASLDAVDGAWTNDYTASWINYITDDNLEFTVPTSGTYYIGFKAGLGTAAGATFSAEGYSIDNIKIAEK